MSVAVHCLVVPLPCATDDDRKPVRLLPRRRLTASILPIVGRATGATDGGNNIGGGILDKVGSEGHGQIIPQKKKCAMQKINLAKCPQCRQSTRMKAIKHGTDKRGNKLAIATNGKTFSVWIQKENYEQGRMVKSWCYIKQNIAMEEAEIILKRRSA